MPSLSFSYECSRDIICVDRAEALTASYLCIGNGLDTSAAIFWLNTEAFLLLYSWAARDCYIFMILVIIRLELLPLVDNAIYLLFLLYFYCLNDNYYLEN